MNATLMFTLAEAFAPENVVKELRDLRRIEDELLDLRRLQRDVLQKRRNREASILDVVANRRRTAMELEDRAFVEKPTARIPVNGRAFASPATPDA